MSLIDPKNTVEVTQGASRTLVVTVVDSNGSAVDLTGGSVYLTVRDSLDAEHARIVKTSADPTQVAIPEPRNGTARIYIVPSDTVSMDHGDYVYDIWVETAAGDRVPVVPVSVFRVVRGVTRF